MIDVVFLLFHLAQISRIDADARVRNTVEYLDPKDLEELQRCQMPVYYATRTMGGMPVYHNSYNRYLRAITMGLDLNSSAYLCETVDIMIHHVVP